MSSGQLQALRNELFSVNRGNEGIAIKALKTDLIKIIVSRRKTPQPHLNVRNRLGWHLTPSDPAGGAGHPRLVCSELIACSVCLCFFMSVEKSFHPGCVVSTVTCHVCWFSEHSVPAMLARSSLKPNTSHGSACLSRSFCTFLVTGHWTRCNHSTCWDRLGRDDVFPTAWL